MKLPVEIILHVAGYLNVHDVDSLMRTAHIFHSLLSSRLYELGISHTYHGDSIIVWAIKNRRQSLLKNLLAKETYSVHAYQNDVVGGTSPLHTAVLYQDQESLRLLLKHRTLVSLEDANGETPLMLAADQTNYPAISMLLAAGPGDYNTLNTDWHFVLQGWTSEGCATILRALMEPAIRPGWNPCRELQLDVLQAAVTTNAIDILRRLRSIGWDIIEGKIVSDAFSSGSVECVDLFIKGGLDIHHSIWGTLAPLHIAASAGNLEVVQHLLALGVDIDGEVPYSGTSLHMACDRVHVEVVNCLLAAGASPFSIDVGRQTPLQKTIGYENEASRMAIIDALVKAGADLNARCEYGNTALHLAVEKGTSTIIRHLVACGADMNAADDTQDTPLHHAAAYYPSKVRTLLELGANIEARARGGLTPLFYAITGNQITSINTLIAGGADITARDDAGNTALHRVASNRAVSTTNLEVFKLLLDKGLDINIRSLQGHTILHAAAGAGAIIPAILELGVPIEAVDLQGQTALYVAAIKNQVDAVEKLLAAGANPSTRSNRQCTPLHHTKSAEIVRCLVNAGCDLSAKDNTGHTAIAYAAASEYCSLFESLLAAYEEQGVEYLSRCPGGRTILEEAAMVGSVEVVRIAIWKGADLNPPIYLNALWRLPLHEAISHGHIHAAEYILSQGADPQRLNNYGHSAIDLASSQPPMREMIARYCPDPRPTDLKERESVLKRNVVLRCNEMLTQGGGRFYQLGRFLLFLGDISSATVALAQVAVDGARCDLCRKMILPSADHFVCLTCEEVDLCAHCMNVYKDGDKGLARCTEHDFIEIPECHVQIGGDSEARRSWLEGTIAKYTS